MRRSGHDIPGKLVVRKSSWQWVDMDVKSGCLFRDAHLSRNVLAGLDLGLLWAQIQELNWFLA